MHTIDKKQQFIELRVEGVSLAEISEKLQVPKSTLWHWNQEEAEHIRRLQLINQDELEAEWLQSREERIDDLHEITMLCHRRLISYFRQHAQNLSPKELFLYLNLTRQELEQYRLKPLEPKAEAGAAKPKMVQNGTISPQNGTVAPEPPAECGRPDRSSVHNSNDEPFSDALIERASGTEMVQNGTLSLQNGTAAPEASAECGRPGRSSVQNSDSEQSLPETCCQSSKPLPLSNPLHPERKTLQNGTISAENDTHPITPPFWICDPKPKNGPPAD